MFFLEFWKRKEITLAYHWDVLEYEEEEVINSTLTSTFGLSVKEVDYEKSLSSLQVMPQPFPVV